jgi:hypothetical protein
VLIRREDGAQSSSVLSRGSDFVQGGVGKIKLGDEAHVCGVWISPEEVAHSCGAWYN